MATEDTIPAHKETVERATFTQWLFYQREASGDLGVVARWATTKDRGCWPHRARTVSHFADHLASHHAEDKDAPTELQVRKAYDSYRSFILQGGIVPMRRGGTPSGQKSDAVHRGYLLPRLTVRQIKELSDAGEGTQGQVIAKEIARAYHRKFKV